MSRRAKRSCGTTSNSGTDSPQPDREGVKRMMTSERTPPAETAATGRLRSIDALRGFDMFWIIGGDSLARAVARWAGESSDGLIQTQLEHVAWEGFRFYD